MPRPRKPSDAPRERSHVYRVSTDPEQNGGAILADRLVRAPHKAMALQHVARSMFSVRIAKPEDYEELIAQGIKIERWDPTAPDSGASTDPHTGELDLPDSDSEGAPAH